jgi:hypothetical protein
MHNTSRSFNSIVVTFIQKNSILVINLANIFVDKLLHLSPKGILALFEILFVSCYLI